MELFSDSEKMRSILHAVMTILCTHDIAPRDALSDICGLFTADELLPYELTAAAEADARDAETKAIRALLADVVAQTPTTAELLAMENWDPR
jgi:hypothetical protein